MLLRDERTMRNYTLQEGYQSCEAGHGEGGACTHKPAPAGVEWSDRFAEVPPHGVTWPAAGRDYSGLRLMTEQYPDCMYVEFVVPAGARAFFNSTVDPWQTRNVYDSLPPFVKTELAAMLAKVVDCAGSECP